eukprot:TRINITY_DN5151_c0_g1_i2.p2 TRINITY_DN5151_c0_g1~~TRINITY_DN5151_c0_g1_i2.p2  ORF type:complete len:118 (+),score=12.01 TRINITY_DN5151_c0_g1_i2:541-894(+)
MDHVEDLQLLLSLPFSASENAMVAASDPSDPFGSPLRVSPSFFPSLATMAGIYGNLHSYFFFFPFCNGFNGCSPSISKERDDRYVFSIEIQQAYNTYFSGRASFLAVLSCFRRRHVI